MLSINHNPTMSYLLEYFDLESCPRPREHLFPMIPEFRAPSGWKDEVKIRNNIEEQRAKWLDDAALSPLTGEILAGVWVGSDREVTIWDADEIGEAELLRRLFYKFAGSGMGSNYKVCGFNIRSFDFEFAVKRAWALKVPLPGGLVRLNGKWADMPPWMIDLRDIWSLGERHAVGDLATIAQFLAVGQKVGHGGEFAGKWRNHETRAEAEAYLRNDGLLLPAIAEHLLSLCPNQYGLHIRTKKGS